MSETVYDKFLNNLDLRVKTWNFIVDICSKDEHLSLSPHATDSFYYIWKIMEKFKTKKMDTRDMKYVIIVLTSIYFSIKSDYKKSILKVLIEHAINLKENEMYNDVFTRQLKYKFQLNFIQEVESSIVDFEKKFAIYIEWDFHNDHPFASFNYWMSAFDPMIKGSSSFVEFSQKTVRYLIALLIYKSPSEFTGPVFSGAAITAALKHYEFNGLTYDNWLDKVHPDNDVMYNNYITDDVVSSIMALSDEVPNYLKEVEEILKK